MFPDSRSAAELGLAHPEKPKVAPIIHERPKMPARTWSALRSHILAERRRRQEEEGRVVEEERLKRERENRKKQEQSSLEVTKEQIVQLEEKLTSLKEEKHQLFLTLKKVLNEDDVRRKKESSEMSSLYPQSHPSVLPMSGHVQAPTSRYMQAGLSRQSLYMQAGLKQSLPPVPMAQPIKRGRSPSPPAVKPYYASSARAGPPAAHSYQLAHTSAAQQSHHRDLLKEAVSAGLGGLGGLAVTPATAARELYGGMAGLAAASKADENYARYLATFRQQLESGNKTAMAAAALSELRAPSDLSSRGPEVDRARLGGLRGYYTGPIPDQFQPKHSRP